MNKAKTSLEKSKDEILANLPKEFHDDFLKEIDNMSDEDELGLTGDKAVAAIKAELKANPAVDENAAAAELKDIKVPIIATPASEAEIEFHKAQLLAEAKAQASK